LRYVAIYLVLVVLTLWLNLSLARPLRAEIPSGVADGVLKRAEACVEKLGLPLGGGEEAKKKWSNVDNQNALRACLREEGPKPESSPPVPAFPSKPPR
jgi:hypothetical protein